MIKKEKKADTINRLITDKKSAVLLKDDTGNFRIFQSQKALDTYKRKKALG
jgi:hypothetical protein